LIEKKNLKEVSKSFGLGTKAEARKPACLSICAPGPAAEFRSDSRFAVGRGFQNDSDSLKRFQRPVSHAGGSVFLLVKPANRWGFVCSSRALPVTAAHLLELTAANDPLTKTTLSPSRRVVSLKKRRVTDCSVYSSVTAASTREHASLAREARVRHAFRKGAELAVIPGGKA
jgi:hypothetical protein